MLPTPAGVELDGVIFLMEPITLAGWSEIEARILYTRTDNLSRWYIEESAGAKEAETIKRFHAEAMKGLRSKRDRRTVRHAEAVQWLETDHGKAYSLWIAMRSNRPFRTFGRWGRRYDKLSPIALRDLVRMRDQLSGTDLLADADRPDLMEGVRPRKRRQREEALATAFTNWRKVLPFVAKHYQISPTEIGRMTLHSFNEMVVEMNEYNKSQQQ